jgi:hypothetical protein
MEEGGAAGTRRGVRHPPPGTSARRWFARVDAFASGTTLAIRRDVVETFGPLEPDINEDVVLPFRASLLGEVRFIDQPLVRVRRWAGSLTAADERLASIEHYRAWWQRGIARARRQLESRLADLDTAEHRSLLEPAELEALREIATASLAEAEASGGLVSPSLFERLRCFARQLRPGTDPRGPAARRGAYLCARALPALQAAQAEMTSRKWQQKAAEESSRRQQNMS